MDKRHLSLSIIIIFMQAYSFTWYKTCIDTVRGSGAYGTDIEVDSLGYPHIIYKEIYDLGLIYCHWDGSQWLYEDVSESLGVKVKGTSGEISLELDTLGYPHIATPGPTYFYKDIAGWHREAGIDPWSTDIDWVSLRLDSKGYPHMAYNDKYEIGPDEYTSVRYCYKGSTGWHVEEIAEPNPNITSVGEYGVSLVLDSLDLPHIIYSMADDTINTVGYAYKDTSGVWHKEFCEPYEPYHGWAHYPNVEIDSGGRLVVGYGFGSYDIDLKWGYRDSSGWHCEYVDTVGSPGYDVGMTLKDKKWPYIANTVLESYNWLTLTWQDSLGWHKEGVDSISSTAVMNLSSNGVVIDRFGYIHISYRKSFGGVDEDRMWYATTNPEVGIGERFSGNKSILRVSSIVYGESLKIGWGISGDVDIGIYNISGREIKQVYSGSGRKKIRADIGSIVSGIYFVVLKSGKGLVVKKITIIR